MAEFAADHNLGEDVIPEISKHLVVEYSATISAGDFCEISGIASPAGDNIWTVAAQAGTDRAIGVAMYAGVSGDRQPILIYGVTKVTFGAAVTVGGAFSVSGNKAINQAVITDGLANGNIISNGAADLDTGLVFINGVA